MPKKKIECKLFPYERQDVISVQEAKQQAGWSITAFNLPDVWEYTQGEGVTIALLDTGVNSSHHDLHANLLPGINLVDRSEPPIDRNGHGTATAGIIAAMNNDIGVVGVAPKAKIVPVKVLDDRGNGNMDTVAEGVRWATSQKVDFISMSIGCPFPVQQVRKAIQAAATAGIITFTAAGNAGITKDIFYPAAYPETIAIGSVDETMHRAIFSNTGKNLDFMAPGVDILSCVPPNWYAMMSGTSMSTPFVCGIAALLLSYKRSKDPSLQLNNSRDYIEEFKKYTIPLRDANYSDPAFYGGFGIIDPRVFLESVKLSKKPSIN